MNGVDATPFIIVAAVTLPGDAIGAEQTLQLLVEVCDDVEAGRGQLHPFLLPPTPPRALVGLRFMLLLRLSDDLGRLELDRLPSGHLGVTDCFEHQGCIKKYEETKVSWRGSPDNTGPGGLARVKAL